MYRSNSFKYERKSPNFGIKLKTLDPPPPDPVKQKAVAAAQAPPVQVRCYSCLDGRTEIAIVTE